MTFIITFSMWEKVTSRCYSVLFHSKTVWRLASVKWFSLFFPCQYKNGQWTSIGLGKNPLHSALFHRFIRNHLLSEQLSYTGCTKVNGKTSIWAQPFEKSVRILVSIEFKLMIIIILKNIYHWNKNHKSSFLNKFQLVFFIKFNYNSLQYNFLLSF